jgi:CheY-like chemotaxis protein
VVEDSPADQEIIRRAFMSADEGCDLVMVLDGESAMAYLQGRDDPHQPARADGSLPDLVLLDLNLPNLTGREVLERIRKDQALRHIPVLILTTTQAPGEVLECYRLGANCFITKPSAFQDFVELIRSTCGYWFGIARLPLKDPGEKAEARSAR